MIVVMQSEATQDQVQHVCSLVREMGLTDHVIQGTELSVVAVIGEDRKKDQSVLEQAPGVDRVMRVLAPYKLAAFETKHERTEVKLDGYCSFGGRDVSVIAGPCSVESEAQIMDVARQVKAAGAHALRGGAFKPRTNPYSFQGLGEDGLKLLAQAREQTGLAVVTEVVSTDDVEMVAKYADCLQVGTRNAQNFKLLEAVGKQDKPVLYKRGMWMTVDEYLQAAEYVLSAGNPNVILCERGIRTFEDHTRNTLSLSVVPELRYRTHLPVIVDPSQGTGHARLVPDMCRASIGAGADGLIIECHPDPEHAVTDGGQSITPEQLDALMLSLSRMAQSMDRRCVSTSPAPAGAS